MSKNTIKVYSRNDFFSEDGALPSISPRLILSLFLLATIFKKCTNNSYSDINLYIFNLASGDIKESLPVLTVSHEKWAFV